MMWQMCGWSYEALYPYLDYRIEDGSGTVLGRSTANTGNGLTDDSFKEYAFGMVLTYDEHGNPDVKVVKSGEKTAQSIVLERSLTTGARRLRTLRMEN